MKLTTKVAMNLFIISRSVLLSVCLLVANAAWAGEADATTAVVHVGGSGTGLGAMQLLADAFRKSHPQASFLIVPSLGSGGGIKALRVGAIDVAVISRPLKEKERGPDITAVEYARTPLVFALAVPASVAALTVPELVSIYAGERKTWPDGRPLRLVLRPESESDTDIIRSVSPEMRQAVTGALARPGMIVALTDKASADRLETIPGAFGTTTLAQIVSENRALKPVAIDGVTPSLATLADAKYRYFKTLFTVTGPSTSPLAHEFTAFVHSPAGREILQHNGNWVAPAK
ncbi:MAG: hypothetical protein B7X59_07985 [Polaromonas sp. 39-63-203]|jgi:phosphate transport system substrate-binding protein|nr:MAG: hypothetical protein B7Y54_02530 [Polaromonas sp. 35-63-240]OYY98126.1 MAG: hypothetical protein B7Y42_07625 [Polaromonas sp. 28-63-22]OYZ83555.1 MAG: hypothetical protein B7Y03_08570 [Polaromonas sp. 24-62-144]OZA97402.1 MAG: hypothetical protein B7X59_07985 [Polaromonas sp. 39-63-203]